MQPASLRRRVQRLVDVEIKCDHRIAECDNRQGAELLTVKRSEHEGKAFTGGTLHTRKPFREPRNISALLSKLIELSLKAFIQVLESEAARHDAPHVAKQSGTIVSSVSYELSTYSLSATVSCTPDP